jgi:AraC-like DNA-binding protein
MVDMQKLKINPGQVLFVLPHQLNFLLSSAPAPIRYYKIGFHANCLSLLPQHFLFLINPLQQPVITLDEQARQRVGCLFDMLIQMVNHSEAPAELILPYLNALMTEFERGYFAGHERQEGGRGRLEKFIAFMQKVEAAFADQLVISELAAELTITPGGLYKLVKHYTGMSPKDYINRRIILEAQRILYYAPIPVKELTYRLGLNDPDYFSRLFRKVSGRTVGGFMTYIKGFTEDIDASAFVPEP